MSLELVATIKAQLYAHGIDLSGPCGAFEITKRVAWALRGEAGEAAGLLAKPSGNNCDGYATDIIIYAPSGQGYDILSDSGGKNEPMWQDIGLLEATRWRTPIPPDELPSLAPQPSPEPPLRRSDDVVPLCHAILDKLDATLAELAQMQQMLKAAGHQADAVVKEVRNTLARIEVEIRPRNDA